MNVTIEDSCIGCGACASICDAVFSVEDMACPFELLTEDPVPASTIFVSDTSYKIFLFSF